MEAKNLSNLRQWDLVRFCRADLHEAGLITDQEYADLVAEATPAGGGAVRRLVDYDLLMARLKQAEETRDAAQAEATRQTLLARQLADKVVRSEHDNGRLEALVAELRLQVEEGAKALARARQDLDTVRGRSDEFMRNWQAAESQLVILRGDSDAR